LAVHIDGFDVALGLVPCFLKAMVTVGPDGGEVGVKVAKHGDFVLFEEGSGVVFCSFNSLILCFGFEVKHGVLDELDNARICFERWGVSVNDNFDYLVEGEGPFVMNPFHNFFVEVSAVSIKDGGHGGFHHLATCEELHLPVFLGDFDMVDFETTKALLLLQSGP
jgi:hypothetical protein